MAWRTYQSISNPRYRTVRVGEVSPRPPHGRWNGNNPYTNSWSFAPGTSPNDPGPGLSAYEVTPIGVPPSEMNRLYARVKETVQGPSGELLTSALEWRSSLDMITKRAITLRKAYLALRRFDLPEVALQLSLTRRQRKLVEGRVRKLYASERPTALWLEYWMGWAPLMGDIGLALETLCQPPPLNQRFSVGVAYEEPVRVTEVGKPTENSYTRDTRKQQGRLAFYGKYRITNHNLALANQLGFTNPAATAWQLAPFSFIVDWVVNVGDILSSMSDFAGISFFETGYGVRRDVVYNRSGHVWIPSSNPFIYRRHYFSYEGSAQDRLRVPSGLQNPVFQVSLPRLSLTRAATAVSLLTEIFLIKK